MEQPKVSVVIPVYNASASIDRCCRSLFAQTLVQMEYIFVSDGSKDDSIQIIQQTLKEFPKRKTQVKVIDRKINKGVSYTRQEGIDNATGEYVIHCDSDDWVDVDMYERLYVVASEQQADIVCCGFEINSESGVLSKAEYGRSDFFSPISFDISPLTGSTVNKLVRRSIITQNNIRFPENIGWGEDFCVAISCLLLSAKTVCVEECPYHYWMNESSITHTLSCNKVEELIGVAGLVEEFLNAHNLLQEYEFQLNYLKFQVKAPYLMFPEVRDIARWDSLFPECNSQISNYPSSFYLRIVAKMIVLGFPRCAKMVLALKDMYQKLKR